MRITRSFTFKLKQASKKSLFIAATGFFTLASLLISNATLQSAHHASAAATPESCFAFDSATGTIVDYGDEITNTANPNAQWSRKRGTCPADVEIPSTIGGVSVTSIGTTSLFGDQLTSIVIPSSVTSIGSQAFSYNKLTVLPAYFSSPSVTTIVQGLFSNNQFTELTIPGNITTIAQDAFWTNSLTSITVSDTTTSVNSTAFRDNPVTSFTVDSTTHVVALPTPEACYTFDAPTKSITQYNYSTVSSLRSGGPSCLAQVTVPNIISGVGVAAISNYAFIGAQLTSLEFAEPSTLSTIGDWAFRSSKLTTLTLPDTLTAIGDYAFYGNRLSALIVPHNVTAIGSNAFYLNQLASLTFAAPSSLSTIGRGAFFGNQLTSITFPNTLTSIGNDAFSTNMLKSVTLPSSISSIGPATFSVQSHWGGNLDPGGNGAPRIYSSDPAEVQRAYDSIWYTPVILEDTANQRGFTSNIIGEDYWSGWDANHNGNTNDALAGYIINAATTKIKYVDTNGNEVQSASTVVTGEKADGTLIHTYMVKDGPTVPAPLNPEAISPAERTAMDQALGAYYRAGQVKTFTPPTIPGYVAPSAQTKTLQAGENVVTFIYQPETTPITSIPFNQHAVAGSTLTSSTTPSAITSSLIKASSLAITNKDNTAPTDCTTFKSANLLAPNTIASPDQQVTILGGLDFTLTCTPGAETKVHYTLGTTVSDIAKLRIYKHSTKANKTEDITSQTTITNLNGKTVISYSLIDGGTMDEDGKVNGEIVDPVYVGLEDATGELAGTGVDLRIFLVLAMSAVLAGLYGMRKGSLVRLR